jgi:hypothetical protein
LKSLEACQLKLTDASVTAVAVRPLGTVGGLVSPAADDEGVARMARRLASRRRMVLTSAVTMARWWPDGKRARSVRVETGSVVP